MPQKYIKILVIVLLASCKPEAFNFPDVPALTLKEAPVQFQRNGKDSSLRIDIDYTDGDGDIGLESGDTSYPFNFGGKFFYNLLINVYKIENGVASPILIPMSTDTINYNDRIKNLTPTGKNKAIYGKISINLNAIPYPGVFPDSMYYTFQIIDRKLHFSNVVQTPIMKFQF